MKTAAINLSFKLLILASFMGSANFAIASEDITECQPALSANILDEKPFSVLKKVNSNLYKRIQCARESGLSNKITQVNLDALCSVYKDCNGTNNKEQQEQINYLLARFVTKKKLRDELPRMMIYSAVKDFLEKEKAFPEVIQKNGLVPYHCATNEKEYSMEGSMNWLKSRGAESSCNQQLFNDAGTEHYLGCGKNRECFGDLDNVLGASKDLKTSNKPIEGYIKDNTDQLITYYRAQNSDEYVEEIRQALLTNNNIDAILKKYRNKSPVLMALYMTGKDRASTEILSDLNPIRIKGLETIKNAKSKSPEEFKAVFKKFQITIGQGMFGPCNEQKNKKFFPWNAAKICSQAGSIAAGELNFFSLEKYTDPVLDDFYKELSFETQKQGYENSSAMANYAICRIRVVTAIRNDPNKFTDEVKGFFGVNKSGIDKYSMSADIDYEKDGLAMASNSAIDSDLNNALINQTKMEFSEKDSKELNDENAVIQANNQNLRGQDRVDSQAFINNFKPIDNYSGLTNEYVNKSYINRADKLKTESTSSSSEANLNKQYSDIEAKIAEAEARLKELQQGMGEVGKNKNQPVVSNDVSREKTQSSSEIEELLKEIKELKAQNNEIKEKLVAKGNTEKAEKVAEKQAGSFNNSPGLAFSSGNKNDYKFESKPVEIKPTSSYSSSQGNSQAMRAPSSLGAAKLGAQASGAILSAVDSKADAVTSARAVTRVDSFNSESARKTITSRINEINKNTKEMEQNKTTIEIDGQLKEVISFEVLDEKGHKKLVVVELKDGKVVVDKDGNPIYVSQDMTDDSIIITKKGKDEESVKKLQSQADVKRVDELKLQKGRSAERVKLNDLTRSAVKAKP